MVGGERHRATWTCSTWMFSPGNPPLLVSRQRSAAPAVPTIWSWSPTGPASRVKCGSCPRGRSSLPVPVRREKHMVQWERAPCSARRAPRPGPRSLRGASSRSRAPAGPLTSTFLGRLDPGDDERHRVGLVRHLVAWVDDDAAALDEVVDPRQVVGGRRLLRAALPVEVDDDVLRLTGRAVEPDAGRALADRTFRGRLAQALLLPPPQPARRRRK